MSRRLLVSFLIVGLAGCVSFNETEFPSVTVPAQPAGREVHVQLAGYDAYLTTYVPVYTHSTVVGSGVYYGPYGRCWGGFTPTTAVSETYFPQTTQTKVFRDRAQETFEKAGCVLQTTTPAYRVDVTFAGPYKTDGEVFKGLCWNFLTLLTADYDTQTWTAKLKIHDLKTGKLVLSRDYVQKYEVNVWGPIPIFSPFGSSKTVSSAMQSWCLTALTDRTSADALAFLAGGVGSK